MTNRPFAIVTWIDASDPDTVAGQSWFDEMELDTFAKERVVVKSAGWVWSDTKLYLTLVADEIIEGTKKPTFGRPTKVPQGMILSRVDVDLPVDAGQPVEQQHQQDETNRPTNVTNAIHPATSPAILPVPRSFPR